jgi:hypothetical protein
VLHDDFIRPLPSTLPPCATARSKITLPGFIVAICASETSAAPPARDQRGGDDDVLLGDVAGHQFGLRLLIFFDISVA